MCKSYSPAATGSWNTLETFVDGCSHPEARCGHASTSNDNIMYIHGGQLMHERSPGYMIQKFTAELLSFDMATLTWKEVTPNYYQPPSSGGIGAVPLPENYMRDYHSLEYVDGRLIMFGGRGEVHRYTGSGICKLSHYLW